MSARRGGAGASNCAMAPAVGWRILCRGFAINLGAIAAPRGPRSTPVPPARTLGRWVAQERWIITVAPAPTEGEGEHNERAPATKSVCFPFVGACVIGASGASG